jgi:hypothetical protein
MTEDAYEQELHRARAQNIAQAGRIIALEQALARCAQLGIRLREVLAYHDENERNRMTEYAYRDAVTGEYVTPEYAKEHPDTTVREPVNAATAPPAPEPPAEAGGSEEGD